MDTAIIQYSIIAIVFIIAVGYVVKKMIPTKKSAGGCSKGCGCGPDNSSAKEA